MASILEEFAYGNLTPQAQYFKQDSQVAQAMRLIAQNEQKLLERLGPAERKLFAAYAAMQGELNELTAVKNRIYGFRVGLLMTAEAYHGMDSLYMNGNEP